MGEENMPKLLIIDDESDVCEFAANFFRKRKIDVCTCSCGEEGINAVLKDRPDLILLDIKMTGMDGIETLKRIKDIHADIKVIMVTGKRPDEEEAFEKCRSLGAIDYIHKPLELTQLEATVCKALSIHHVKQ